MKNLAILLLVLFLITPAAYAEDWNPPPWRGDDLSAKAQWQFEGGDEAVFAPISPTQPVAWWPESGNVPERNASWNDSSPTLLVPVNATRKAGGISFGGMHIVMANWLDDEPLKLVRIQIGGIYEPADDPGVWWEAWQVSAASEELEDWDVLGSEQQSQSSANTFNVSTDLLIRPNPDWEIFSLDGIPDNVVIDQLIVDTVSIPEPSSFALAGVGALLVGAFVLVRRRRS